MLLLGDLMDLSWNVLGFGQESIMYWTFVTVDLMVIEINLTSFCLKIKLWKGDTQGHAIYILYDGWILFELSESEDFKHARPCFSWFQGFNVFLLSGFVCLSWPNEPLKVPFLLSWVRPPEQTNNFFGFSASAMNIKYYRTCTQE